MYRKVFGLILIVLVLAQTACFWKKPVRSHEVGLILEDGATVTVDNVVSNGRYSETGYYAEMIIIDGSAKTLTWSNDEKMVTFDKQPITMELVVTYARALTPTNVIEMYNLYHQEAINDEALRLQVEGRIREVAKGGSTGYTLDAMLGLVADSSRSGLSGDIFDDLAPELAEINVLLLDVRVTNIDVADTYMAALEAKAQADIDIEVSQGQTALLAEQLNQERARTEIAIEQARSEYLVAQQEALIYQDPLYLELEKLRIQYSAFGRGDTVIFIPQGTQLNYIMNDSGNTTPAETTVPDVR